MDTNGIFSDFAPTDKKTWRALAEKELKNLSYQELLTWEIVPKVEIEAYYDRTTTKFSPNPYYAAAPEQGKARHWQNLPYLEVGDPVAANKEALSQLNSGADGILFGISLPSVSVSFFESLLENILLPYCQISFVLENNLDKKDFLEAYATYLHQSQDAETLPQIVGFCKAAGEEANLDSSLSRNIFAKMPHFQCFMIEIEETQAWNVALAKALKKYTQLLQVLEKEPFSFTQVGFSLPQIDNYFLAIAIQMSLRKLAAFIAAQTSAKPLAEVAKAIRIHTYTRLWAQEADTHTNLIRNTTQAMSAILGGCDSLSVLPFAPPTPAGHALAQRMARNVSLILTEEAYFDKVNAPLAGSYFVETLTQKLSEDVWAQFQS
ncbi:methylmalonyl-CoA mutase family protein [Hugenholtzia roseola]|uniref:methylmalonyl-CoA mutase family protein n=1 Tax=Hugenholtzia roseola TaxID=1002 RepID=UPI00041991DE|nr:methylmalonyl-CoA mutase family protein [Hugenholtzia roseola]